MNNNIKILILLIITALFAFGCGSSGSSSSDNGGDNGGGNNGGIASIYSVVSNNDGISFKKDTEEEVLLLKDETPYSKVSGFALDDTTAYAVGNSSLWVGGALNVDVTPFLEEEGFTSFNLKKAVVINGKAYIAGDSQSKGAFVLEIDGDNKRLLDLPARLSNAESVVHTLKAHNGKLWLVGDYMDGDTQKLFLFELDPTGVAAPLTHYDANDDQQIYDIAIADNGDIYLARNSDDIKIIGGIPQTAGAGQNAPQSLSVLAINNTFYVVGHKDNKIWVKEDGGQEYDYSVLLSGSPQFSNATAIAKDSDGNIYIAGYQHDDNEANKKAFIIKIDTNGGTGTVIFTKPNSEISSIALEGNLLYFAGTEVNGRNKSAFIETTHTTPGNPTPDIQLEIPSDLYNSVSTSGKIVSDNDGNIYIAANYLKADTNTMKGLLIKITPTGEITSEDINVGGSDVSTRITDLSTKDGMVYMVGYNERSTGESLVFLLAQGWTYATSFQYTKDGNTYSTIASSIAIDDDGTIYIAGHYVDTADNDNTKALLIKAGSEPQYYELHQYLPSSQNAVYSSTNNLAVSEGMVYITGNYADGIGRPPFLIAADFNEDNPEFELADSDEGNNYYTDITDITAVDGKAYVVLYQASNPSSAENVSALFEFDGNEPTLPPTILDQKPGGADDFFTPTSVRVHNNKVYISGFYNIDESTRRSSIREIGDTVTEIYIETRNDSIGIKKIHLDSENNIYTSWGVIGEG